MEDEEFMNHLDYSDLLPDEEFEADLLIQSVLEPENVSFDSDEEFLKCISTPKKFIKHEVDGVEILFPYQPYFSQEQMMNALVRVARDSKHALLESPTGTGKTAALLCGLLGWLKHHEEETDALKFMADDPWEEMLNSDEDELVSAGYDSFLENSPKIIHETPSPSSHLKPKNHYPPQYRHGTHEETTLSLQSPASNDGDESYTQIVQVPSPAATTTPSRPKASLRFNILSPISPMPGPSSTSSTSTPCSSNSKGPSVSTTKRPAPWQVAATQPIKAFAKSETAKSSNNPKKSHTSFNRSTKGEDEDENERLCIIYATRTHSQIAQIVKQLKDTHYARTPMTVLGSRKHCCINPVAIDPSKYGLALQNTVPLEEACTRMRKVYLRNEREKEHDKDLKESSSDEDVDVKMVSQPSKSRNSQQTQPMSQENAAALVSTKGKKLWPPCQYFRREFGPEVSKIMSSRDNVAVDIEDIRKEGEKRNLCPYYALNELRKSAKLVVCTYDHLLHFGIRKACQLDLKNSVLVFDEAHNIEDKCREIASMKLSYRQVVDVCEKLQKLECIPDSKTEVHKLLVGAILKLAYWMLEEASANAKGYTHDDSESTEFDEAVYKSVTDIFIKKSEELNWGPSKVKELWAAYYEMSKADQESNYLPPTELLRSYARILHVFHYVHKSCKYDEIKAELCVQDYNIFIQKSRPKATRRQLTQCAMLGATLKTDEREFKELNVSVLCLNPAVAFEELKEARAIVVASGTLSPIDSFASELNVDFEYQESLPHVLGKERIFPAIVSRVSPTSQDLNFSYSKLYSNFDKTAMDLLETIYKISVQVPKGVLVFLPSKAMLQRMREFWETKHQFQALKRLKKPYYETDVDKLPPEEFIHMMSAYKNDAVSVGALLFAVLRGKVSEGVDFKDDEARAVLAVGIPFALCKEKSIVAKQAYNNKKHEENSSYLDGKGWYQGQAFRALNQALGRCIRHAQDWGLIFVVDCRFAQIPQYRKALPGWIMRAYNSNYGNDLESILKHAKTFISNVQKLK